MLGRWRKKRKPLPSRGPFTPDQPMTPEELRQMYLLVTESLTIARQVRLAGPDDQEATNEGLVNWSIVMRDLDSINHLQIYIWCLLTFSTTVIDSVLEAMDGIQKGTARGVMEALAIPDEVIDDLVSQIDDIGETFNFERIILETISQLSAQTENPGS